MVKMANFSGVLHVSFLMCNKVGWSVVAMSVEMTALSLLSPADVSMDQPLVPIIGHKTNIFQIK